LAGHSLAVSYSFDDSAVWSKPILYPLGQVELLVDKSTWNQYSFPGEHELKLRCEDATEDVHEASMKYTINREPVLHATSQEPLLITGAESGPIALPLTVSDSDGDGVSLWYRFEGQGDWTFVPASVGANVLPASAFSGKPAGSAGFIEVAADDGYEHSQERLKIGYSIEDAAPQKEDTFFGALSPAAFAGIIVGSVAVIVLAIAMIVAPTCKKAKSSSPGLIENE
jgi:hypothetical protein